MKSSDTPMEQLERSMRDVARGVAGDCESIRSAALADIEAGRAQGQDAFPGVHAAAQRLLSMRVSWKLGMGFVVSTAQPGARTMHWWFRPVGDAEITPLLANSQPATLDYYDFEQSDWWQDALSGEHVHISEPYMDAAGTNAYVLTGSLALHHDEQLFGVAVIDVAIGELQALWQADLMRLERTACVVSEDGAVIATNSGRLLGENIELRRSASEDIRRVEGTPWAIVRF